MARHPTTTLPGRAAQPRLKDAVGRIPGLGQARAAGEFGELALKVIRLAFTPPYPWWRDAVVEFSLAVRRCIVPLVISMITFSIGIGVLYVGQIIGSLGTPDRLYGGLVLGFMREPSEWVTAMMFAGVAGSAMTADLGARKIRDELDALTVLGVDNVRTLVVPRVVAMTLVAPVLAFICLLTALVVLYILIPVVYPSVSYGSERAVGKSFLFGMDVMVLLFKMPICGFFVGMVSCYKGLTCGGGAEGVGKAVNSAVVIMFLGLWILNGLVNGAYLALFPNVLGLRG